MHIKEYKCPNCGGGIQFDIETQLMRCPSCGTAFDRGVFEEPADAVGDAELFDVTASADAADEELFDVTASAEVVGDEVLFDVAAFAVDGDEVLFECSAVGAVWESLEDDDLASGECPSCGAELFGDKTAVAMVCPFCGNAQIIEKRLSGMLKPNYIIPFKLDKNAVMAALSEFCGNKRLLPDSFAAKNRLTDLQGVYAPFWLFDAAAEGDIVYHATKVTRTKNGSYTTHYTVQRAGRMVFEKIPVDGSEKMDDDYMDAIEPFDYRQLEEFRPSYLAGYAAEKYDVDAESAKKRAKVRIIETVEMAFRYSVSGYTKVETTDYDVNITDGRVGYGLFPVWMLNTKYDDENYLFMMNGQTGKLVGRLPVDESKAARYNALITGACSAVIAALMYFFFTADVTETVSRWIFNSNSDKKGITDLIAMIVYLLASADVLVLLPVITVASVAISILIGRKIVGRWRRQMDTVEEQETAFNYAAGGVDFTLKTDVKDKSWPW